MSTPEANVRCPHCKREFLCARCLKAPIELSAFIQRVELAIDLADFAPSIEEHFKRILREEKDR